MEDGAETMCVVVVVCGLANNHRKQQTHTASVDETKDDNEEKAPATSSAERCWICVAIISALLYMLKKTLNISLSIILIHNKKTGKLLEQLNSFFGCFV